MKDEYLQHLKDALNEFYDKNGVGDTINHKFRFWKAQEPTLIVYGDFSDEAMVAIYEVDWLMLNFPQDFSFN